MINDNSPYINMTIILCEKIFDVLDENGDCLTVKLLDIIDFNHKQFAILHLNLIQ